MSQRCRRAQSQARSHLCNHGPRHRRNERPNLRRLPNAQPVQTFMLMTLAEQVRNQLRPSHPRVPIEERDSHRDRRDRHDLP